MSTPQFSLHDNLAEHNANRITYFGVTDTRGKHVPFGIKQDDRSKHTYVIGKSGMGKSTLLENMAVQDIQNGEGVCFIDPHGGTAEKLMQYIPEHRVRDVLYFAPFDLQYPISFNVLENVDADKRHLVVAGLMSAFEKIWVDAWSARMAYILQNTIGALLEFPGATLLGVNRMYIDKEYRKNVVSKVTDPSVRSFWVDEFTKYTDRYAQEATPAIQNKIGQFASNALVRNVIGQEESSFNIRDIMDNRKIFIVNLSKGRVGEGNANLLGSMLITKMYLAAMSRADVGLGAQRSLPPFFMFVDEFQNFANKSFAEILSEARKYKLALTIAHQYIEQMEEEVRAAVFGNVGTMITFRVGAYDADVLEKEFAPTFEIDDLVNLGARQIYLKLMIDSVSSQPFSATTLPPIPEPEVDQTDRAIAFSRAQYSRPRAEVEKAIEDWTAKKYEDPEAEEKEKARLERRATRDAEEGRPPRDNMASTRTPAQGGTRSSASQGARPPLRQGVPQAGRTGRPPERTTARPAPNSASQTPRRAPAGAPVQSGGAPKRPTDTSARPVTQVVRQKPDGDAPTPTVGNTPAPSRDTPARTEQRPVNTTRPPQRPLAQTQDAPVTKERSANDLRGLLSQISSKQQEQKNASVARENASVIAKPVKEVQERPGLPKPSRDDGKSISDEGKAELRNLLSSLAKDTKPKEAQPVPASAGDKRAPDTKNATVPVPKSSTSEQALPVQVLQPPKKPVPTNPPEIAEQKLRDMLHVDKPNV